MYAAYASGMHSSPEPERRVRNVRRVALAVVAAALVVVLASCVGPPVPPPTGGPSDLIPCSSVDADHEIVANAHLDPSCVYTGHIRITNGGVRLDCNGAVLRGTKGTGIEVSTPVDVSMEGVRIQECRTDGFLNGIRVTRTGFRGLEPGHRVPTRSSQTSSSMTQKSRTRAASASSSTVT